MKIKPHISGLALLVMGICLSANAYSQKITVIPFATALAQNQTINNVSFLDLTLGVVPTIYLKNGAIENQPNNANTPIRLIVDASSFHLLNDQQTLYSQINLIEFKLKTSEELSDLQRIISLKNFPQLNAIYFSCSFKVCGENGSEECQIQTLENSISHLSKAGLSAYYTSLIEE
jgi:hypothetical protein